MVTLARWLGHSFPAITLSYYAHFMPEAGAQGAPPSTGCRGVRRVWMPAETPQIPLRADRSRSPGPAFTVSSVDCTAEALDGLG